MFDEAVLKKILLEIGINHSGIVQDTGVSEGFFVFADIVRDEVGKQTPSSRQLAYAQLQLESHGASVNFIIVDSGQADLLESVKSAVFLAFPDMVRNIFISFDKNEAVIWVEPKTTLEPAVSESVAVRISEILEFLKVPLRDIYFTNSDDVRLPTPTAILQSIRIKSPVGVDDLIGHLESRNFSVPSSQWINRILDRLRKSKKIIRQKSGTYILTLMGLSDLGTAKHRRSADVSRALDMARRGG